MENIFIKKAYDLINNIYKICALLPMKENFGLYSQTTRASVSILCNYVEGQQRTRKEFLHFLLISKGSIEETKILLNIIKFNYNINTDLEIIKCDELGKMLHGLIKHIKYKLNNPMSDV